MQASLSNYQHAPRKVRLVADLVRGKTLAQAILALSFLPKKASLPLKKLLESAAANARASGVGDNETLLVKEIRVDKGLTLRRFMPRARGRATPIRRHASHVTVVLGEATKKSRASKTK